MNERILRELRNHSNQVFNRLDIELSGEAKRNFDSQLEDAVRRMERDYRTSDGDIRVAQEAFTTFINSMYRKRDSRYGQKDIVRYTALLEAKGSICPLWPIC